MRTKSLIAAAAIFAAACATSMAQSNVYSLNVVGYVNKSFQQFLFTMVSNPLKGTNNALNTIIPNAPDGTSVYRWNVAAQDFQATVPTFVTGSGWAPNSVINPGEAFFVAAGENFTNTFVGEVSQGSLTNALVGNLAFEAIASIPPVSGSLTNVLKDYPALDGDSVYTWNVATQDFNPTVNTYVDPIGWTPDANIAVGEGFYLVRQGGAVNYVRNFTVQ